MAKGASEEHGSPAEQREASVATGQSGGMVRRALAFLARYKGIVRVVVLLLIVLSVGFALQKSWSRLPAHLEVNWALLGLAYLLLVAQELSFAFIWRSILARLGSRLDVRSAQQIYLGSEFVRYIPGNVWHVLTRIVWAERRGVPRVTGFASMTVELATKIASAALVFAVSLLFWTDVRGLAGALGRDVTLAVGLVGVPLLLLGLHPRLLTGALNVGLRKLGRQPVAFALGYRDVLIITLLWSASWVVAGAGFYLLTLAFWHLPLSVATLMIAAGIYAIGWDIGFLSFVTPSGLGFREVVLAALLNLSGLVPSPALAVAIAVVARLLVTGAELVCVAGAHLLPGGRAPAIAAADARETTREPDAGVGLR